MTDQQSAEVEVVRAAFERLGWNMTPVNTLAQRIETLEARLLQLVEGHAIEELANQVETLTRGRDEAIDPEDYKTMEEFWIAARARAERAEAQRDRLAEAARIVVADFDIVYGPIVDALSEIEQAASNDGEKEAVT